MLEMILKSGTPPPPPPPFSGTLTPQHLNDINTTVAYSYGDNVAINADGTVCVVAGMNSAKTICVFRKTTGSAWGVTSLTYPLTSTTAHYGRGMALSLDGNSLVVGAYGDATKPIFFYEYQNGTWNLTMLPTQAKTYYGGSLAISEDANTIAVGCGISLNPAGNNFLYILSRSAGVWSSQNIPLTGYTTTGGASVALDRSGTKCLLGTVGNKTVVLFVKNDGVWQFSTAFTTGATNISYGNFVAMSADGQTCGISDSTGKIAHSFKLVDGVWTYYVIGTTQDLNPGTTTDALYGISISFNETGDLCLVGSPYLTKCGLYKFENGSWSILKILTEPTDKAFYGRASQLSADGTSCIIGARNSFKAYYYQG